MDPTFVPHAERPLEMRVKELSLLLMEMDGVLFADPAKRDQVDPEDLAALKRWSEAGGVVIMTSAAGNPADPRFCAEHGFVYQAHHGDKDQVARVAIMERGAQPRQACFVGATKDDLPAMMMAGVAAAVATDDEWVSGGAHLTTEAAGGAGALAELVEKFMSGGALTKR